MRLLIILALALASFCADAQKVRVFDGPTKNLLLPYIQPGSSGGFGFDYQNLVLVTFSAHVEGVAKPTGSGWRITSLGGNQELRTLTGGVDNDIYLLFNVSTDDLKIKHETGSPLLGRFSTPDGVNFHLKPFTSVYIRYDGTLGRWHLIDVND